MVDVVTDAIHRLTTDQWWDTVHRALDRLPPQDVAALDEETDRLDGTAGDGIRTF